MNDLKETVRMTIEKLKKHRILYEKSEESVRLQIINPILKGIGWDPENPEEVQPNIAIEEGIPDYSLLKDNQTVLFVEAKRLSVDITQKDVIRQLAKYCFGEGMRYGVLTNGSVWLLFRAFQERTTITDRIVWKIDIENDDLTAIVRRLSTISRKTVEDIEILIKKLQILDEIWQSLLDDPKEIIKGLTPVFKGLTKEGYPDYEFETSDIEDFMKERVGELILPSTGTVPEQDTGFIPGQFMEHPRRMEIQRKVFEIRNSYEVLINTANWLIENGRLRKTDCPIVAGPRRNLINVEPKHRYNDSFRSPKRLSNGLWIETSYSTASCINTARRLLERYDYNENILKVQ